MRNKKVITIFVLMIVVVGLGIGFAAFSSTITITSGLKASPDSSDFVVRFSKTADSYSTGYLTPTSVSAGVTNTNTALITGGVSFGLNNSSIGFTEPGQSVTYDFYVRNDGQYTAYLNSIYFGLWGYTNTVPNEPIRECAAVTGGDVVATDSLVSAACSSIYVTVTYTGPDGTTKTITSQGKTTTPSASLQSIDGITLDPGEKGTVKVVYKYDSNGTRADGPFTVSFRDITFNYSTAD